jgi:flagellar basal-body rod modification protein FlgD
MATSIQDLGLYGIKFYEPNGSKSGDFDATNTKDLQTNFLRLLTVQLQNQDPMNPLESAEMTSQLAQLNMVDGINKMNTTMSSLVSQMQMSDFMSQANTIGKSAMAASNLIRFDGQNPVVLGALFDKPVTDAELKITDMSGNVVLRTNLGSVAGGVTNLMWDGMAADGSMYNPGTYRMEVTGKSGDATIAAKTLVASVVATVGRGDDSKISMTLADGRKITPDQVVQWVLE